MMMSRQHKGWMPLATTKVALACALALTMIQGAQALQTDRLMDDSMADFAKGNLTTSTLTQEGLIRPPYLKEKLAEIDTAIVWDVEPFNGETYLSTGHKGELFKFGVNGLELVHDFEETGLYAITAGEKNLYVGASPSGTVYTVDDKGEVGDAHQTGEKSIWDIIEVGDDLFTATGPDGRIVRIDDKGTTSTLVQIPNVTNILDMEYLEEEESFIVATQGTGLLVRISKDGEMKVLIDPEQEEIRRVGIMPDGSILGAVNGVRSPGEELLKDAGNGGGRPNNKPQPTGFLVRVYSDGFVEEFWTSPEHPIHDFAIADDGRIVVAAGDHGLLYEVTPDGKTNTLGVSDEKFLVRLAPEGNNRFLIGTGASATLMRLDLNKFGRGEYESQVFDAKASANWASLMFLMEENEDVPMRYQVRYGNTAKADESWSEWTEAESLEDRVALANGPSRFFQYRILFDSEGQSLSSVPLVDAVRVFYTQRNRAPRITDITVNVPNQKGKPAIPEPSYTGRMQRPPHSTPPQLEVTWRAEDPNGDTLAYDIYLKVFGDSRWTLVEEDVQAPSYTLETNLLPSGDYRAKIVAKDIMTSSPGFELTSEAVSSLFLIDNTQPKISGVKVDRDGDEKATVLFTATDGSSLIASVAWRSGFDDWMPLYAEDGVLDEQSEEFMILLDGEAALPDSFLTVLVTDEAGNTLIERINLD